MELTVETSDGEDLLAWLTEDSDVACTTVISPAPVEQEGKMGTGFDLLNLVLSNSISLSGLIVSIMAFRESRRRSTGHAPPVSITYQTVVVPVDGDEREVLRLLTDTSQREAQTEAE